MAKRGPYETPAEIVDGQHRFEQWRSSQPGPGRRAIPEALWTLAIELAQRHGVFRTAKALRLDSNKLSKLARAAESKATPERRAKPQPAFVELIGSPASPSCECIIEVEGPRGRMRIEWKGSTAPDLPGLSRVLWEPGA